MFPIAYLRFSATTELWIALIVALTVIAIGLVRTIALPTTSKLLIAIGSIALAFACGVPIYIGHRTAKIAAIVDTSASTRGATFLERTELDRRLAELLPTQTYSVHETGDLQNTPADADAIVLFSDARFDAPSSWPATYVVIDPALENPSDGAIARLMIDETDVRIAVRNQSPANEGRRLAVDGIQRSPALPIGETLGAGSFLFQAPRDVTANTISARIIGGDRWPENDALQTTASPGARRSRWFVSDARAAPDASWTLVRANDLPLDPQAYLAPSTIVLDDEPASAITPGAQQRIAQYVRDLGGALIISGGEHAFGAGAYFDSPLESLSPLSSAPPTPTRHWIVLVDSSGSMAGEKWRRAVDATLRALQSLPTNDLVTIGSFARELRWWSANRSVVETRKMPLPPPDVVANGPTNLQPALADIIARAGATQMPTEILILSDADAKIDNPSELAERLRNGHARVSLLATGDAIAPQNPVAEIAQITGGQMFRESDPANWSTRVNDLLRAAMPELLTRGTATVNFDRSVQLPSRSIDVHNRTWPKADVHPIATIADAVVAATWNVGAGSVIALGFSANAQEFSTLADQYAQPPRDPRFTVRRDEGSQLHIAIDAIANGDFLNALPLQLALRDDSSSVPAIVPFTQTAPGRYELTTIAPRTSKLATILLEGRVIDRFALAGRYDREFDAIGNDRDAMRELAHRTGGRVIEPAETQPLNIRGPERRIVLASEFAFVGVALIAIGLIHWRRSTS